MDSSGLVIAPRSPEWIENHALQDVVDEEFIQLLVDTNLINQSEYESLTRKYKDFDFRKEQDMQANWIAISKKAQEEQGEQGER